MKSKIPYILAIAVCISIVVMSFFFVPGLWLGTQQNEEEVYRRTIEDVHIRPAFYRDEISLKGDADLRFQLDLDTGYENVSVQFFYEIYECDLHTFDANYQLEGELDPDFRSDYYRMSGRIPLTVSDTTLGGVEDDRSYIFVYWLESPSKTATWTFSIALSVIFDVTG